MPKVSICIPTYVQTNFLKRNLDSLLTQTYQDFEIVVTDDTPNDVVQRFVSNYDFGGKLRYYRNASPMGSPENWNESVRRSKGEYIKMLHHDDFLTYPTSLADFVEMLDRNPQSDFAFSAAVAENVKEGKIWIHAPTEGQLLQLKDDPRNLFFVNFIGPPSSTIYRNGSGLFYDKKLKWVVDFDFYIQCLLKNPNFQYTPRTLITSVSGANHNVTNDCIDNGQVEIFEYMHLYNKLSNTKNLSSGKYAVFMQSLFEKYSVNSLNKIREYGYLETVPFSLRKHLYTRQAKRVLRKVKSLF